RAQRRITHHDDVALVLPLPRPLGVVLAGELNHDVDVVVDLARVWLVIEALAILHVAEEAVRADALNGERVDMPEEDAARGELMAAEFGHQAAAGAVVEAPADQFVNVLVIADVARDLVLEFLVILLEDRLVPAVANSWLRVGNIRYFHSGVALVGPGKVAVPQSTNVLDVAE